MEKRVKIYLGIAAILILLSLMPLLEAYKLHNNRQVARHERLLTELTIDKQNITQVNAADNINVDMISVEHIFVDAKGKEIVAHNMDDYNKLINTSTSYIRTYQLGDQILQITESLKDKLVSEVKLNKKKTKLKIKTNDTINQHYIKTPIIYEKKIKTGETLLMLMQQTKQDIQYIGMQSHTDNMIGKTTLDKIDLDGPWNNRLNLVGFETLAKQHIMHYIFYCFIFLSVTDVDIRRIFMLYMLSES